MGLVSLDDVDHCVVEDPSSLVDEASLGDGTLDLVSRYDGDLGIVEDASSLVDEAFLGDGARGVDLDQRDLELCFLRRNGVKTLSLTLRSAGVVFREAIPRDEWNAHCSHIGRLVFERNAQCLHVARRDGAPHSGARRRPCTS